MWLFISWFNETFRQEIHTMLVNMEIHPVNRHDSSWTRERSIFHRVFLFTWLSLRQFSTIGIWSGKRCALLQMSTDARAITKWILRFTSRTYEKYLMNKLFYSLIHLMEMNDTANVIFDSRESLILDRCKWLYPSDVLHQHKNRRFIVKESEHESDFSIEIEK